MSIKPTSAPDAYRYCPECGFVGRTTYDICEINGAGSPMIEVDQYVAEDMIRLGNALLDDDGTLVRVGPVAVGRSSDHAGRMRWFVKRWRNGTEWRTGYGSQPIQAARRAFSR
jgi:hypothetical protein